MNRPYFLPPKDLLFKLLDKDIQLIVENYGKTRPEEWKNIYQNTMDKESLPCVRETVMNSQLEKPKCVPDSNLQGLLKRKTRLVRNRSAGIKRRRSSVARKLDVSAYRAY